MSNLESLDWDDILSQPNDEWYCPQIIESAYSGKWVGDRFPDGTSALHIAANLNQHKNIDALLQSGGNINVTNKIGQTPLFNAIINDSLEFAYKLISNQIQPIDLNHIDFDGKTAFDYCEIDNRCFQLYEKLVNHNKIQAINKHEAVRLKEEEIIKKLNNLFIEEFRKGKQATENITKSKDINDVSNPLFDKIEIKGDLLLDKMSKREALQFIQKHYPELDSKKIDDIFYYLGNQKKHPYLKIQTQFNIINQGNYKSKSEFLVMITERFVPEF